MYNGGDIHLQESLEDPLRTAVYLDPCCPYQHNATKCHDRSDETTKQCSFLEADDPSNCKLKDQSFADIHQHVTNCECQGFSDVTIKRDALCQSGRGLLKNDHKHQP